jgi:hypothetical protein
MTVFEKFLKSFWLDFKFTESWLHKLNGCSSSIRERSTQFSKESHRFYWHVDEMIFIEGELSHNKRRNLTIYENSGSILFAPSRDDIYWRNLFHDKRRNMFLPKTLIGFICTQSFWYLWKGSSSTMRERTWHFRKSSLSIFLAGSRDGIYWMEALPR